MDLTDVSPLCNATNLPNFVLMVNTFRFGVTFLTDMINNVAPVRQDNSSHIQQTKLSASSLEVAGELGLQFWPQQSQLEHHTGDQGGRRRREGRK